MSSTLTAEVKKIEAPKSATKPQKGSAKPRSEKPKPEVVGKPRKGGKARKNAKKRPANIDIGKRREYTDKRLGTTVVQHSATYTMRSGAKANYSVSAILRALGFYCGASGSQGFAWCQHVGLTATGAGTCGQQCGTGRRAGKDKKGNPVPNPDAWHGSVPVLSKDEVAELKATFAAATKE